MGTVNLKLEFPCGYKVEAYLNSILLHANINDKDLIICPLHGKDCKKMV